MLLLVDTQQNSPSGHVTLSAPSDALPERPLQSGARPLGCLAVGAVFLTGGWILLVEFVGQTGLWVADQTTMISHDPLTGLTWTLASGAIAAAVAGPAALLRLIHHPDVRRAALAWLAAAAFALAMAPTRLPAITGSQVHAALQVLVAGAALLALRRWLRPSAAPIAPAPLALALLAGLAPWVWLGALGSLLDTALALSIGLLVGSFAAELLYAGIFAFGDAGSKRDRLPRLLAAIVCLAIVAGATGWRGLNVALVMAVPATAVAATALFRPRGALARVNATRTVAALVAGAIAGPLALADASEMVVVLGLSEAIWPSLASFTSAVLVAIAGAAIYASPAGAMGSRRLGWGAPAVAIAASATIYFGLGHPGFYGDRLFVVMRDQADVTDNRQIPDRARRLTTVYERLTTHAMSTQSAPVTQLRTLGVGHQSYYLVNAIEVRAEPLLAPLLAAMPGVDRVLPSPRLRPATQLIAEDGPNPSAGPPEAAWNIRAVNAPRVWTELGVTGQGIVVGQSDSGVDGHHPALASSYRGATTGDDYNWLDPWSSAPSPRDVGGHGTHTLGTAVGQGGIGVAPGATWMACANLERNLANPALYLDCMQFMLAPYPRGGDSFRDGNPTLGAHVLNNSWGCPSIEGCDPLVYAPAVRALTSAGIFVVASAGNDGPGCGSVTSPPAIYADVLSVGAVDRNGRVTAFSSRGPVTIDGSTRTKPDLVAPGADVISAVPGGRANQWGYASNQGTSMAGPHVVGVVALMWSAQPALVGDIESTRDILLATARPLARSGPDCGVAGSANNESGFGMVDAYAAVTAARQLRR
jgi:hypothetical protein